MKISLLTSSSNQFRIRKFVTEGVACQPLARWHATPSITTSLIPNDSKFSRFFDQLKIALQVFVEYLFPSGFFLLRNNLIKKNGKIQNTQFRNWFVDLVNKIHVSLSSSKSPILPITKINFFHELHFLFTVNVSNNGPCRVVPCTSFSV